MKANEQLVWARSIRLNVETVRASINKIRAELAVIDQALAEIHTAEKALESG